MRYCSTCREAHEQHAALALGAAVLAALAGASIALALPVFWPQASRGAHLGVTGLAAVLPLALLGVLERHTPRAGRAPKVWGVFGLGSIVEGDELAQRLAAAGRAPRALWLPALLYRGGWIIPALALLLAALAHAWHHPRLWVLNLAGERAWLELDGARLLSLEPALGRDAEAAVERRLPRGRHQLRLRDARGAVLAEARVELHGGRDHLYAPGGTDECFWLEITGYGRDATRVLVPLASESRFFGLERDVDTWFSENPAPPGADRRSTGGTLTALRHSPCRRAPEAVRRAASAARP